jgi:hypothetical protein
MSPGPNEGFADYALPWPEAGKYAQVEIQKAAVLFGKLLRGLIGPLPVTVVGGGSGGGSSTQPTGAANSSQGQPAQSTSAAQIVPARPTRTGVAFTNLDAAITVYFGPAGVTTANGYPLKAGMSWAPTWVGAIFCVAASGTPVVSFWDEYN